MIEKQIDETLIPTDFQAKLASDERETGTEFKQELRNVLRHSPLDIALLRVFGESEEVENVWILQNVAREIRLLRR